MPSHFKNQADQNGRDRIKGASIKDVPTRGEGRHHNGDIWGQGEGVKVNKDVPFKY